MSVFSKIFIVINLGLTLLLVGVMGTLLSQKADYRVKYTTTYDDFVETKDDLTTRAKEYEDRIAALSDADKRESDKLAAKIREKSEKIRSRGDMAKDFNAKRESRGQLHTDIRQLTKTNNNLDKEVSGLVDDRKVAVEGRDKAVAAHKRSLNELGKKKADLAETETGIADLKGQMIALKDSGRQAQEFLIAAERQGVDVKAIAEEKPVSRKGLITGTSPDVYLCIVSLGRNDNIKQDMVLRVQRGSTYIGLIKIRKVFANWASAQYMMEFMSRGQTPRKGDEVTTDH